MQMIEDQAVLQTLTFDELKNAAGGSITFCACVHYIKKMGGFAFVILRTGKYVLQSVYSEDKCSGSLSDISEGCYIKLTGEVYEEERAALGYEISLLEFTVLSKPAAEYPLHIRARELGCTIDTKLEYRSTALRNPKERAVFKISEGVCEGFRQFLLKNNFTEIHTPKIVAAGAEGGANMFKLKYFGKDALLAQSPQFYKQTCVAFFDRVFEIAPVYRAEKHNSTRHLNEYIGLDLEMAYIEDMRDIMVMETRLLQYICKYVKENYQYELEMFEKPVPEIKNIPAVTFFEALDILGKAHYQADLDPQDEIGLCEYVKEKYDSDFVFVEKFPSAKRPVYAKDSPEDPKLAESFDLLFRGLEITTGGQRIHDYNEQIEKMKKFGVDPEELSVYLQIHKYGMPPHGGLGIGLERLVMKLLNLPNIRQASLFPRDINHLDP